MDCRDRITINAARRRGRPCLRNLRLTVDDVLEYLAGGTTESELLEAYPELTLEDVAACREFAELSAARRFEAERA